MTGSIVATTRVERRMRERSMVVGRDLKDVEELKKYCAMSSAREEGMRSATSRKETTRSEQSELTECRPALGGEVNEEWSVVREESLSRL